MIERGIIAPIVRDLESEVETAKKVRSTSLLSVVDRVSERAEEITGTKEGSENWKRLLGFAGFIVGGTLLAGELPNKDAAMAVSDVLAAFGGAFAGNEFRPISRIGRFNKEKFVKKLTERDFPLDPQDVARFFATYEDILTEDDIKKSLLGRNNEKDDPRNMFIRYFSQEYRRQLGKPSDVESRRLERIAVKELLDPLQLNGQTLRANKDLLREEGVKRVLDIASGVAVIGAAASVINVAFNGVQGGMIGAMDEVVTIAVIFGSVALKELDERQKKNASNKKSRNQRNRRVVRVAQKLRVLKSPNLEKDQREGIGKGGHGNTQR